MWPCDQILVTTISMREVIITSILRGFDQIYHFFEGSFGFKVNYLGLALGMALNSYASVAAGLKLKVRKCRGLIPTFFQICEFKFAVT